MKFFLKNMTQIKKYEGEITKKKKIIEITNFLFECQ